MKIGIFGGSFDPVHLGHVNLAVEIMEKHNLDEVWFCPSSINPNKIEGCIASSQQRLDMLGLAIAGEPRFRVLDAEIHRQGTSFTIDTLEGLIDSQTNRSDPDQFYLIIGDDAAKKFHTWHRAEEIVKLVPILVGNRTVENLSEHLEGSPVIVSALKKGITQTRVFDISSTEVRKRLAKGLYCENLVHPKVLDYIYLLQLYCKPPPIRK